METMNYVVSSQDGPVLQVVLNRPEVHNAFNRQLVNQLTDAFRKLKRRKDVRAVILTGSGRSFCAGADLTAIEKVANRGFDRNLTDGQAIFDLMMAVDSCPVPVVGKINGPAFGGGMGLMSCCDIAIAERKAVFGFSEVRLGLVPAVISPFVLAKIGESRARELFLTGERFSANYALSIGLLHHVVDQADLDEKVDEIVAQLLKSGPSAQNDIKRLIAGIRGKSKADTRGFTTDIFARRWNHEESSEGIRAFLEKRDPSWRI